MDKHSKSGDKINQLSILQINSIIEDMVQRKFNRKGKECRYLYKDLIRGKWKTDLKPTKTKKGNPKYPQYDISHYHFDVTGKVLVHHLYFRYVTEQIIDSRLHISHLDLDPTVVECVQESKEMNESRKYCHQFGWYKRLPGENRRRCPHWDHRCSGP